MATATPCKRPADVEPEIDNKRTKIGANRRPKPKTCTICCEQNTTFPKSSKNCKGAHKNDVCHSCWRKYITVKVMDDVQGDIECMHYDTCKATITYEDLERIVKHSKPVLDHYGWLVRRKNAIDNNERECLADRYDEGGNQVTCRNFQQHDAAKDGRIFICKKCGDCECAVCNVPEHQGETCGEFKARLEHEHGEEERKTTKAFLEEGYEIEKGRKTIRSSKLPKPCPRCGVLIDKIDRCDHMKCPMCANQFCYECDAPYFGKNSVPELGNAAHQPHCSYAKREHEDWRFQRPEKYTTPTEVGEEEIEGAVERGKKSIN